MSKFFVTDSPGYFGDETVVHSSHSTLEEAIKATNGRHSLRIYIGEKQEGDRWFSFSADHYTVATWEEPREE